MPGIAELKNHLSTSLAAGAVYGAIDVGFNKTPFGDVMLPAGIMAGSEAVSAILTTWVLPYISGKSDAQGMAEMRMYVSPLIAGGLSAFAIDSLGYGGDRSFMNRFLMGAAASGIATYVTTPQLAQ